MRDTVSFYLDSEIVKKIKEKAVKESRTLSSTLEIILEEYFCIKAVPRYSKKEKRE